jgi:hypothetical protein
MVNRRRMTAAKTEYRTTFINAIYNGFEDSRNISYPRQAGREKAEMAQVP